MKVQEYLEANGLQSLVDEFHIGVTDYEDRVVLNYNQIDSPRFNPICDECRALILHKNTWAVMARSFDRFYNVGEGDDWKDFPMELSRIEEKRDGSIISVYNDGYGWHPATRKRAYAEGETPSGLTFKELFFKAVSGTNVMRWLDQSPSNFTYIFELTSPINRVVTPYEETSVTLIGIRNNLNGFEVGLKGLDSVAGDMGVVRPEQSKCNTIEDVQAMAESLDTMEEGFVLVVEQDGSFRRLKCKNSKYLAIAHMRNNGVISPRRILTLVIDSEEKEYLSYFPEDQPYFDFVIEAFHDTLTRMFETWEKCGKIESQKDFALAIKEHTKYSHEAGMLFRLRKGTPIFKSVQKLGDTKELSAKKLAKSLNLRKRFAKRFGIELEND